MPTFLNKDIEIVTKRKSCNEKKYEKLVEEANRLSKILQDNNLTITDTSGTWQTPEKDHVYKYVNGTLYKEWKELDLYKHNKGQGTVWETKKERIFKVNMQFDSPLANDIRMFKRQLRYENIPY